MGDEIARAIFTVKYEGKPNEVSAETLLDTLAGVTSIVNAAAAEMGGVRAEMKVRVPERGSFLLDLAIDPHLATTLLGGATEAAKVAADLMAIAIGVFTLRKFLKKEAPSAVNDAGDGNVTVRNSGSGSVTVNQRSVKIYLGNPEVPSHLDHVFDSLEKDSTVEAFTILDQKRDLAFRASREEFASMSAPTQRIEEKGDRRIVIERHVLPLHKVCFEPGKRWSFISHASIMGAEMADKEFMDRVASRSETFISGDSLDADVRMEQARDPASGAWLNKSVQILKVHQHIHSPDQPRLSDLADPPPEP